MSEHSFERLRTHILPLSLATDFEDARKEWRLDYVDMLDEPDKCPCGQTIMEQCHIVNTVSGHTTAVGNVCVNRFLGIDTHTLVAGLKRIAKDLGNNANEDVIVYAMERQYITENEYVFLLRTSRKRLLSQKQINWKIDINRRILDQVKRRSYPQATAA